MKEALEGNTQGGSDEGGSGEGGSDEGGRGDGAVMKGLGGKKCERKHQTDS